MAPLCRTAARGHQQFSPDLQDQDRQHNDDGTVLAVAGHDDDGVVLTRRDSVSAWSAFTLFQVDVFPWSAHALQHGLPPDLARGGTCAWSCTCLAALTASASRTVTWRDPRAMRLPLSHDVPHPCFRWTCLPYRLMRYGMASCQSWRAAALARWSFTRPAATAAAPAAAAGAPPTPQVGVGRRQLRRRRCYRCWGTRCAPRSGGRWEVRARWSSACPKG
jgi:hypothetical protein